MAAVVGAVVVWMVIPVVVGVRVVVGGEEVRGKSGWLVSWCVVDEDVNMVEVTQGMTGKVKRRDALGGLQPERARERERARRRRRKERDGREQHRTRNPNQQGGKAKRNAGTHKSYKPASPHPNLPFPSASSVLPAPELEPESEPATQPPHPLQTLQNQNHH
jgi:hypothetical protein